jgi:hypothetical protein
MFAKSPPPLPSNYPAIWVCKQIFRGLDLLILSNEPVAPSEIPVSHFLQNFFPRLARL